MHWLVEHQLANCTGLIPRLLYSLGMSLNIDWSTFFFFATFNIYDSSHSRIYITYNYVHVFHPDMQHVHLNILYLML